MAAIAEQPHSSIIKRPYPSTVDKIVYVELNEDQCFISTINMYPNLNSFLKKRSSTESHPDAAGSNIGILNKYMSMCNVPIPLLEMSNIRLSNGYTRNFEFGYLSSTGRQETVLGSQLLKMHANTILYGSQSDIKLFGVTCTYTNNAVFVEVKTRLTAKMMLSKEMNSSICITCVDIPLMNYIPIKSDKGCLFSREEKTITLDYLKLSGGGDIKTHTFCLTII